MEVGNLPEKELKIMIVKMIQDLRKRMEAKVEKMQTVNFIIIKYSSRNQPVLI